jgi:hypothetical protein
MQKAVRRQGRPPRWCAARAGRRLVGMRRQAGEAGGGHAIAGDRRRESALDLGAEGRMRRDHRAVAGGDGFVEGLREGGAAGALRASSPRPRSTWSRLIGLRRLCRR